MHPAQVERRTYAYEENGNALYANQQTSYGWDGENRLASAGVALTGVTFSNAPDGTRLKKSRTADNVCCGMGGPFATDYTSGQAPGRQRVKFDCWLDGKNSCAEDQKQLL